MFEVLERSWSLTKLSARILSQDKEMLLFPLLGGIFSLLFFVAMLFPTGVWAVAVGGEGVAFDVVNYVLMAITYFGLAFVATFFNVCVVFTTRTRFEGGDATFAQSIAFALSRVPQIAAWSALSASVGLFLHALDRVGKRHGGLGQVLVSVARGMLGMAWSVVTLFVVPVMVYEGVGPFDAVRRSMETLRHTWGESLVRHVGLGVAQSVVLFAGLLVGGVAVLALANLGGTALAVGIVLLVAWVIVVVLVFQVLNAVFNTALYVFAQRGQAPGAYDADLLSHALRVS